jgi:hypothetical protein
MGAPILCRAQGAVYGTPIYDPEAKRYFELIDAFNREWKEVKADAETHQYKGVQGRLAIVDSAEVHNFLLLKFRADKKTWIGMEYMCQNRVLIDSTGKRMDGLTFQAWAREWKLDGYACNSGTMAKELEYMPLAYTEVREGFRWTGWGVAKRFDAYFIEYPTGAP